MGNNEDPSGYVELCVFAGRRRARWCVCAPALLDCREKFDLLGNFREGNFVGQLANRVQDNSFWLARVNTRGPRKNEASWKISGSN